MKTWTTCISMAAVAVSLVAARAAEAQNGWIPLFNGKDLTAWKASTENPNSFSVKDGAIHIKGGRAHLFYTGDVKDAKFRNFEFKAKVMTRANANSGIYFATEYQAEGWPAKGYECQVNNSFDKDPRRTGSLYAVKDLSEKLVPDDQWFDYGIKVENAKITISINGKVVTEYTEKEGDPRSKGQDARWIKEGGTFAFQAHDPGCEVFYKDIMVKPLP